MRFISHLFLAVILISSELFAQPPGWNYKITGISHSILIETWIHPNILGDILVNGDYIGVFYDSLGTLACGGYSLWNENNISITAWGDDPTTNPPDGFEDGEDFKWKIWRQSDSTTFKGLTFYRTGTPFTHSNQWSTNGLSGLESLIGINKEPNWNYSVTPFVHSIKLFWNSVPNIVPGDFIGTFYDSLGTLACGGFIYWTLPQDTLLPISRISAFGDDVNSPQIEGFAENEEFKWKVFKQNDTTAYDAIATYSSVYPDSCFWTDNGLSGLLRLQILVGTNHAVNIKEGWNIISSYIHPDTADLDLLFQFINSDIVIAKNGAGQIYWPQFGINTIGSWVTSEGYLIKLKTNRNLYIVGQKIVPELNPINIPQGWSILAYYRDNSMSIESIMSGIVSDIIMVKNDDGEVYWPEYSINQIGNMQPGEGYQIKMQNANTLTYPPNSEDNLVNLSNYDVDQNSPLWSYHNTGVNHIVLVPISSNPSIQGTPLSSGDYIGAFYDSSGVLRCAGYSLWTDTSNISITVWGDDGQTADPDGYAEGEEFTWRIWRESEQQEFNAVATYQTGGTFTHTNTWSSNGISGLSSLNGTTPLIMASKNSDEHIINFRIKQNYPNPFNPTTIIEFDLSKSSEVTLKVFNILGEEVSTLVSDRLSVGSYSYEWSRPAGIASGVYLYRLQAGDYVETRKMVLMR